MSIQPYSYEIMDKFKRLALQACRLTKGFADSRGYHPMDFSWGESAFVGHAKVPIKGEIVSKMIHPTSVLESLGTKILVADAVQEHMGLVLHNHVAQCNLAMSANDLITLGGLPFSYHLLLAVGSDEWFKNEERSEAIVNGTHNACVKAKCVWGGGETPTLTDIILPNASVLAGSIFGLLRDHKFLLSGFKIQHGDAIVILRSSGVHSNGISKLRQIAAEQRDGYATIMPDGRTFGESILDATLIYSDVIEECQNEGVDLHYAVNITGHGWAKLLRATENFRYVIDRLPKPHPIFEFVQDRLGVSNEKMYSSYNMGGGFALYADPKDAERIVKIATNLDFEAVIAGHIERAETRSAVLDPIGVTFTELNLR